MITEINNTFTTLETSSGTYKYASIVKIGQDISHLPFSLRVLLENLLRNLKRDEVNETHLQSLLNWSPNTDKPAAIPFFPGRVILQDFTGLPVINDLAAMRAALQRLGGNPARINPLIPVDMVIDHSIQVDQYKTSDAWKLNAQIELERNRERYEFLRWGQKNFDNLHVIPPASGIIHQVNLEFLSRMVLIQENVEGRLVFPDTLLGTDSHTTMINGLGVLGWGVGGIEAVAALLGQPIEIQIPDVVGIQLNGSLQNGVTPTDLTLSIAEKLRESGVVGKFVEFYGPGLKSLSLADRAMISNMTPEYGATMSYFPVDEQTINFLKLTGRPAEAVELAEKYYKAQQLFRTEETSVPKFSENINLDLGVIVPSLAGPRRPQDRISLRYMKQNFQVALTRSKTKNGFGLNREQAGKKAVFYMDGEKVVMEQGAVVIAAITSCTNTSNPSVMIGAGLLAKKAVEKGLKVKPYVKTSLTPGSRVVTEYLEKAALLEPLSKLGFNLAGYGCATCIGNSGPLEEEVVNAIQKSGLVTAAVLSGNRNFEGRVSPFTLANYLASPPLVVVYALAGTVDINLSTDPIGEDREGNPVYLPDIWPSSEEIQKAIQESVLPEMYSDCYADIWTHNKNWNDLESKTRLVYKWDKDSNYLQEPPYFKNLKGPAQPLEDIVNARVLAVLGDSITTDHISPAGVIPREGAAGKYLLERGVRSHEFNSFGSRRGNDRIMTRGTFGNIRLKNLLTPDVNGSFTLHLPDGDQMSIYEASMKYQLELVPLIILAGKEYGTGSSRDWAAKGTLLLGVKAVLAESYERIHRSNLIGMGVLPLQFMQGQSYKSLGLSGHETFNISGIQGISEPSTLVEVEALTDEGKFIRFKALSRLDTPLEMKYFKRGGIMNSILYDFLEVN